MVKGQFLFVLLASVVFLSLGYVVQIGYGQFVEKGIIGQVVGNDNTEIYVRGVNVSEESGAKIVVVSAIFKNKDAGQQTIYPSTVRLVDSQSREYEPEYSSKFPSAKLPTNDILAWNGEFKILPTNNVSKIYFTPDGSESRFTVDLTKSMNPPADPPKSSWVLSSNKGVKLSNRQLEITINDEKYIGNTYVVDLTIKNIGSVPFSYTASDFEVKDADGFAYSYNVFYSLLSPLLSGDLPPNEEVRGDIAFDVKKPNGNMMIILSVGYSGEPYLNSGRSPVEEQIKASALKNLLNTTNTSGNVEIVMGSSTPSNGKFFDPESTLVARGSSVVWTNQDDTLHTVTSGSPESGSSGTDFDSSYLATGKTFEHIFDDAGTFDYYCTLHPYMKGQVVVK
jgi:plastocyanin